VAQNIQYVSAGFSDGLGEPIQVGRRFDAQFAAVRKVEFADNGIGQLGLGIFFLRVLNVARVVDSQFVRKHLLCFLHFLAGKQLQIAGLLEILSMTGANGIG